MTVRENLEIGAYIYRADTADRDARIDRVLDLFPDLARAARISWPASMSGGQQQMLALAITLLHDPDVLLIDELSLGLSPVVVQELLQIIERLKAAGDDDRHRRAVAERRPVDRRSGRVPREGPGALRGPRPKTCADRDDLVRAVFLGTEGG